MAENSGTLVATPPSAAAPGAAEVPRRLVVELNKTSARDLAELVDIEELNKTTIVNRAIQLYKLIRHMEMSGGKVYVQDPGAKELQRIRII